MILCLFPREFFIEGFSVRSWACVVLRGIRVAVVTAWLPQRADGQPILPASPHLPHLHWLSGLLGRIALCARRCGVHGGRGKGGERERDRVHGVGHGRDGGDRLKYDHCRLRKGIGRSTVAPLEHEAWQTAGDQGKEVNITAMQQVMR
jgi:hypothetical protein